MRRLTLLLLTLAATLAGADPNMPGTDRITYFGYEDCILLENAHTRVVLTSSAGRVLEYSRKGPNAIYLDPAQEGATFEDGDPRFGPTGGRLDIGPEMIIPAHPDLWLGQWGKPNHRPALGPPDQQRGRAYRASNSSATSNSPRTPPI